jgi:hypothetical protein
MNEQREAPESCGWRGLGERTNGSLKARGEAGDGRRMVA